MTVSCLSGDIAAISLTVAFVAFLIFLAWVMATFRDASEDEAA